MPIATPQKNLINVVFLNFKPISANDFLSNFTNRNVVKSAAIVPIMPWDILSNLSGIDDFVNEKIIKSPVNTIQNRVALKIIFVRELI